jgi:3-dehydroquinate synthase
MKKTVVNVPENAYNAIVGEGIFTSKEVERELSPHVQSRRCLVISDSNVALLYAETVMDLAKRAGAESCALASFPAGESSKTLETVGRLCSEAVIAGLTRKSVILALGGGVVGDIAGFVASSYMRGIEFVQIPTTLLAMVDSSVGGKVGVDLPEGKNLVGAFHQPRLVVADLSTLGTLPEREIRCGMAEVIKYGVIMDRSFLDFLSASAKGIHARSTEIMTEIVCRSCDLKARIVREDERESGIRAILNYGHTFGHAIETLTHYDRYNHGEAVAIGMGMAVDLAHSLGRTPVEDVECQDRLLQETGLPIRVQTEGIDAERVFKTMHRDKKALNGKLRLVLPRELGRVEVIDSVPDSMVIDAIRGRCD